MRYAELSLGAQTAYAELLEQTQALEMRHHLGQLKGSFQRKRLKGRDFIVDDYSIADIAAFPWALSWERQGQAIDDFPRVKAWIGRISERQAVQRGLSKELK